MKLIRYTPRGTRFPVGVKVSVDRSHLAISAGIRDRGGLCLVISLESEAHWMRRHAKRHAAVVARVIP